MEVDEARAQLDARCALQVRCTSYDPPLYTFAPANDRGTSPVTRAARRADRSYLVALKNDVAAKIFRTIDAS